MGKKRKLDVPALVRGIARERIGQPGSEKVVPDKRRKKLEKIRERESREDS